jgi:hypothetical protein
MGLGRTGGAAVADLQGAPASNDLPLNYCSKNLKSLLNFHANQYLYCFSPLDFHPASVTGAVSRVHRGRRGRRLVWSRDAAGRVGAA